MTVKCFDDKSAAEFPSAILKMNGGVDKDLTLEKKLPQVLAEFLTYERLLHGVSRKNA